MRERVRADGTITALDALLHRVGAVLGLRLHENKGI